MAGCVSLRHGGSSALAARAGADENGGAGSPRRSATTIDCPSDTVREAVREAASSNHDSSCFVALSLPLLALGIIPNAHGSHLGCFALLTCAGSQFFAILALLGNVCFLCHQPSPHVTLSLGFLLWALGCDPTHRAPATTVPPCAAWLSFLGAAAMLPVCLAAFTHCSCTAVVASNNGQLLCHVGPRMTHGRFNENLYLDTDFSKV